MIKTNIMKVAVIVLFCVVLLTACKQNPAKPTEPSDTEPVSTEQVTEPVTGESRMWFLSKYEIDLTGDGLNERIEIEGYAPTKESAKTAIWQDGFGKVTIYQGGSLQEDKVLFSTEISKKHEGLGDLAVCDYYGRNCLVRFENTPRSGRNEFWYEVIGFLEDGTTEVLKKDYAFYSAPLSIEDPIQIQAEGQMRLNPVEVTENLVRVHDGLDEILQGKYGGSKLFQCIQFQFLL